jgi:DNA replication protein DnaC
MSLENYRPQNSSQSKALEAIRKYDLKSNRNVILHGPVGTGKTHLAVGLCRRICASPEFSNWGREVTCFRTGVELLHQIRSSYSDSSREDADDIVRELTMADFLFIDDLGAEKVTEWAKEILYLIIDRRYTDIWPTIITSNLAPKELAVKLDDRLMSRLMQDAIVLRLDGDDYRIEKGKEEFPCGPA